MKPLNRAQWIESHADVIRQTLAGSGIFPAVAIAQLIVESQGKWTDGNYYIGQSILAKHYNNYFGIKAAGGWNGATVTLKTGEYIGGKKVTVNGTFRAYPSFGASLFDYVKFLKENPRYTTHGVFTANTPQKQAEALQAAGYATSPNYATLLKSVINSIEPSLKANNLVGTIDGHSPEAGTGQKKSKAGLIALLLLVAGGAYVITRK